MKVISKNLGSALFQETFVVILLTECEGIIILNYGSFSFVFFKLHNLNLIKRKNYINYI